MRANSLALRLFLSATVSTVLILFATGDRALHRSIAKRSNVRSTGD